MRGTTDTENANYVEKTERLDRLAGHSFPRRDVDVTLTKEKENQLEVVINAVAWLREKGWRYR